jgi:hypothetical protein
MRGHSKPFYGQNKVFIRMRVIETYRQRDRNRVIERQRNRTREMERQRDRNREMERQRGRNREMERQRN